MEDLKAELMECVKEMDVAEVQECLEEYGVEDAVALAKYLKK